MVTKLLADTDFANPAPAENLFVNGGFEDWNGGTFFGQTPAGTFTPITGNYTADKWAMNVDTTPSYTVSRESTTANVDTGRYSCKVDITSIGAGTVLTLFNKIFDPSPYLGKTISISIRVKASVASKIHGRVSDGIGQDDTGYHSGSGNWETLTLTHVVPLTATQISFQVGFLGDALVVTTFWLDSCMMVLGSNPVAFVADSFNISFLKTQTQSVAENILINGGMEFWQRGLSFSSPAQGVYTADRWKMNRDNGFTYTVSQESTIIDGVAGFSLKNLITVIPGAAFGMSFQQVIENYGAYAGKTLSFTIRARSSNPNTTVMITDGVVSTFGSKHSGGGAFETLGVTKTISAATTGISIFFGQVNNGSATGTDYYDSAMLTVSDIGCPYIPKNYQAELAQCQRYYEKSYLPNVAPGTSTTTNPFQNIANGGTGQSFSAWISFKVDKRTNPTVTVYDVSGNSGKFDWGTLGAAFTSRTSQPVTSAAVIGTWGFHVSQAVNATDNGCGGHWTASAEL
jgi:hypothetical protein